MAGFRLVYSTLLPQVCLVFVFSTLSVLPHEIAVCLSLCTTRMNQCIDIAVYEYRHVSRSRSSFALAPLRQRPGSQTMKQEATGDRGGVGGQKVLKVPRKTREFQRAWIKIVTRRLRECVYTTAQANPSTAHMHTHQPHHTDEEETGGVVD